MLACGLILSAGHASAQSVLDGFAVPVAAGLVREVRVDANGQILIGGDFTYLSQSRRLIRVKADGSEDTTFVNTFNPPGTVTAIHPRANGTYLVGGNFSGSGVPSHFAWLNSNGSLFSTYDLELNGQVRAIAQAADHPDSQNFYIGGEFTAVEGANRHRVARLKPDMSFDATFNPPLFDGSVNAVLPLPGGKLLVGGGFLNIPGQPAAGQRLFRLNANGSLDTTFVVTSIPNGLDNINSLERQSDGKYLVAGNFNATSAGQTRSDVARFNTDGSLDLTFTAPSISGELVDMDMQPDGRAVIVGTFGINRLNVNGNLDVGFGFLALDPDDSVLSVEVQGDGAVLVGGRFTELSSTVDALRVARLSSQGFPERDFAPGGISNGSVLALATQANGDVIVGGEFTALAGQARTYLARMAGTSGLLSGSFTPTLNGAVRAIVILPDGKFLAGGDFTLVNGSTRRRLARFESNGSLDASFTPADIPNGTVYAIERAPDGKIYIGGSFTSIGGELQGYFTRLLANGALDPEFADTNVDGPVRALAMEWDQYRVYIGGEFDNVDGIQRRRVARVWPNGLVNSSFNSPSDGAGFVEDLVALPDGGVVAAGLYASIYDGLVKLDVNGAVVSPFPLLESGWAQSVVLDHEGRVYVGGTFTQVNGSNRFRLARIAADGTLDTKFTSGILTLPGQQNPEVLAMTMQGDGRLVIGGSFSIIDLVSRSSIARLGNRHGVPEERLVMAAGNELRWVRDNAPAELRAPPTLQIATTCCSAANFTDVPGTMVRDGDFWSYASFPVPSGTYYVKARARVGDGNGMSYYDTPIHQFNGPSSNDTIFANGFDGVQ